jgi:hypothetical protein
MRVVIHNLSLEVYYGAPGCWVSDLGAAYDFRDFQEAERAYFRDRLDQGPWSMQVLFVSGEARFGIKLPVWPVPPKPDNPVATVAGIGPRTSTH